jgi:hypothetical protein
MADSPIGTMPAERQFRIFRFLQPDDLDDPNRDDLGAVRLTCKALTAVATELFFENHFLLIWKKDHEFTVSPSNELLHQNPQLAALVKNV